MTDTQDLISALRNLMEVSAGLLLQDGEQEILKPALFQAKDVLDRVALQD